VFAFIKLVPHAPCTAVQLYTEEQQQHTISHSEQP